MIEGGHADNPILECAAAATADFLVTGDRRHLLPLKEYGVRESSTPPGTSRRLGSDLAAAEP